MKHAVIKPILRTHILRGGTPKEFSYEHRLAIATVGKLITQLGIKKVFITEAEHTAIKQHRCGVVA